MNATSCVIEYIYETGSDSELEEKLELYLIKTSKFFVLHFA